MSFPENIIDAMETHLLNVEGVDFVVPRSLNPTDPHGTLGLVVEEWSVHEVEMGPLGFEPSLSTYTFVLQHMVKESDQIIGEKLHRETAKRIRLMLYRDESLAVAFRQLQDVAGNRRERPLKWQILGQRFASNEIAGHFVSLSVTEFSFTTETSNF